MATTLNALRQKATHDIINYEPPYRLDEVPVPEGLEEDIPWPKAGSRSLAPKPVKLKTRPAVDAELPKADVVVVTWTVAEGFALGDVLTPGFRDVRPGKKPTRDIKSWYVYRPSNFKTDYVPNLRRAAPARQANRLGSYFLTTIFNDHLKKLLRVLCFKSELHLNRDWISNEVSARTMPVADLFVQIIKEARPKLIITVGTAGATLKRTGLGDVMVTRSAQFRLSKAFKKAPFSGKKYACKELGPLTLANIEPTVRLLERFKDQLDPKIVKRTPKIWSDGSGGSYSNFHPILTTDSFEFGTTRGKNENYLANLGCGVEMGDAALGMVAEYLRKPDGDPPWEFQLADTQGLESAKATVPKWLVIRNASDPQIDASLSKPQQIKEAVFYYKKYGYFTSVNSAFAVWAAIRGLNF